MSGKLGDGTIVNWLSPTDVHRMALHVLEADIVARRFVVPDEDLKLTAVRATARRAIAAYLNVLVYAEFHRWLGRGGTNWSRCGEHGKAGDRSAALAAVPDELIDELFLGLPRKSPLA